MPLYPVQEGHTYTIGDRIYKAGEFVDLTEGQAAPWVGFVLGEALTHKEERAVEKAVRQAAKDEVKTDV